LVVAVEIVSFVEILLDVEFNIVVVPVAFPGVVIFVGVVELLSTVVALIATLVVIFAVVAIVVGTVEVSVGGSVVVAGSVGGGKVDGVPGDSVCRGCEIGGGEG
jgi:hypothetical protein